MLTSVEPSNRRERGAVLVLVALTVATLALLAAFAVDLGNSRQVARQAQAAVDAAALAGARDLPGSGTDPAGASKQELARSVAADYAAVALGDSTPPVLVSESGATVEYEVGDARVWVTTPVSLATSSVEPHFLIRVRACRPTDTFFARVVGLSAPEVCREAVARRRQDTSTIGRGLIALNQHECGAMLFSTNKNEVLNLVLPEPATPGAVIVESDCPADKGGALRNSGNFKISTPLISVVGGYDLNPCEVNDPNGCTNGVVPLTGQPRGGDPLQGLALPTGLPHGSCSPGKDPVCTPGRYTTQPLPSNVSKATFEPGIYVFEAGINFKNADVTVLDEPRSTDAAHGPGRGTGAGAIFIVTGGEFDLSGNGTATLRPPTEGPFVGISIWQPESNDSTVKITGDVGSTVGTIYAPGARLEFGGNTSWDVKGSVIADTIELFGSMNLRLNADGPAGNLPGKVYVNLEQ